MAHRVKHDSRLRKIRAGPVSASSVGEHVMLDSVGDPHPIGWPMLESVRAEIGTIAREVFHNDVL
jgi:hypothetical protein